MKKLLAIVLAALFLLGLLGAGASAQSQDPAREETLALLADVQAIFAGGGYTFKGSSNYSQEDANSFIPLIIAANKGEGLFAAEYSIDYRTYAAIGLSLPMTVLYRVLFGTKLRVVFEKDDVKLVFPSRRSYLNLGKNASAKNALEDVQNMLDLFGQTDFPAAVVTSKQTIEGKEYLVAATKTNGYEVSYYFLNGQLKKLESIGYGYENTFYVDQFSAVPDAKYFSIKWMFRLPINNLNIVI